MMELERQNEYSSGKTVVCCLQSSCDLNDDDAG